MAITKETLRRLAEYDTPTICNAIELFEIRPRNVGFMDGRIKASFPELPPMVGFASTAAFRSGAPATGNGGYANINRQIESFAELPGAAVLVFQDLDDPPVGATFGEVMCSTYRAFGSTGLITSGAGRDVEQVCALEYPIFTGSTICSHAYCRILQMGQPVRLGSLAVNQGDLLHGDANGVTSIPVEVATELPDAAARIVAAEKIILDYLRSTERKTTRGLAEAQQEYSDRMDRLGKRLAR